MSGLLFWVQFVTKTNVWALINRQEETVANIPFTDNEQINHYIEACCTQHTKTQGHRVNGTLENFLQKAWYTLAYRVMWIVYGYGNKIKKKGYLSKFMINCGRSYTWWWQKAVHCRILINTKSIKSSKMSQKYNVLWVYAWYVSMYILANGVSHKLIYRPKKIQGIICDNSFVLFQSIVFVHNK